MNYEIKYTILQIYVNWFGVVNTLKQAASWFKTIHSIYIHLVTLSNTFFFMLVNTPFTSYLLYMA